MHDAKQSSGKTRHLALPATLALCGIATSNVPAYAAILQTCRTGDSPLACQLRSVLGVLDTAAWILGLLLVVAVATAVVAYRRKPRKLTREEVSADDL